LMVRVKLLVGPGGGRFPWSNCLLVESGRARILVDTGCCEALRSLGAVDFVVYTHFHPDHFRCIELAPGQPRILAPIHEEPYSGAGLRELALRFAPGAWREWVRMAINLMGVKGAPKVDEYYKPGETLRLAGVDLETLHAPGHMASHTLLVLPDGTLYLSDIDLTSFGPWYGNPESDPVQFLADIDMARRVLEEGWASRVATSHVERVMSGGDAIEALKSYEDRLWMQARRVLDALRRAGPAWPWQLAGRRLIYPSYTQGYEGLLKYFEGVMIAKLLW